MNVIVTLHVSIAKCDRDASGLSIEERATLCLSTDLSAECQQYCNVVKRARVTSSRKLTEILAKSLGKVNEKSDGVTYQEWYLPVCYKYGDKEESNDCWTKVLTDRGLCFASLTGTLLRALLT